METIKSPDLSLWEAAYWVARKESFTAAARALGLSTPVLSKKIAKLEEQLGVRLFQRSTRRVSLTQETRELLPQVEAMLEDMRSLEGQLSGVDQVSGLIRLTCIPALGQRCLSKALPRFQEKYPGIRFDLHLSDQLVDLIDAQLDLAIRVQEPTGAEFVYRKLIPNELALCASPAYLKKHGAPARVSDLRRHRLLVLSAYEDCAFLGTEHRLGDFKDSQLIRCESGTLLTELALQGAGIAARSTWDIAPLIRERKLAPVLPRQKLEPFGDVYAVTPHRKLLPQRVRAFLDFLQLESKRWG